MLVLLSQGITGQAHQLGQPDHPCSYRIILDVTEKSVALTSTAHLSTKALVSFFPTPAPASSLGPAAVFIL